MNSNFAMALVQAAKSQNWNQVKSFLQIHVSYDIEVLFYAIKYSRLDVIELLDKKRKIEESYDNYDNRT